MRAIPSIATCGDRVGSRLASSAPPCALGFMPSRPLRFSPSVRQLVALDAAAGGLALVFAMVLRFLDEGAVPATYAQRLGVWFALAALVQMVAGEVMTRLRRPRSALTRRPLLPFLIGALASVVLV